MKPILLLLAVLILSPLAALPAAGAGRPNIIILLIDDMGWKDLACTGSKLYETPAIDKLAARGVRFTNGYSACTVCSPTRAAILTGQYPARLHITDWIRGHNRPFAKLSPPQWTQYLPRETTTIAELLKAKGYVTAAIGKWHLGDAKEGFPTEHGFDINLGGTDRGQPPSYFAPYKIATLPEGPAGEYLTDREATEACRFIEANRAKPFFLYLPHHTVHTPLQAKKEKIAKYQAKIAAMKEAGTFDGQGNATYAAMIESLDESIAAITAKLDELTLTENTLIIFTGDNGGLKLNNVTDNSPLRAGKGSAYEGGVRVPLIVAGPGVKAGTTCAEPAITMDVFATAAKAAGAELEGKQREMLDGLPLQSVLSDPAAKLDRAAIYWHYPHYHPGGAKPYSAVRAGDWRLVHFYEDDRIELYNLKEDAGERVELAHHNKAKAAELKQMLDGWRQRVGAQPPVANPNFDDAKDKAPARPKPTN